MSENFTIPIDKRVITMLIDKDVTINQYLDENERSYSVQLLNILLSYHSDQGGAPDISDYDLDEDEIWFDSATLKGSFSISYLVSYYYGCVDMNNSETFEMSWNISIDLKNETITFTGPEKWIVGN